MLYFLGTWVAGGLGPFTVTALLDAASVNSASAVSTAQQGSLLGQLYQDYGVLVFGSNPLDGCVASDAAAGSGERKSEARFKDGVPMMNDQTGGLPMSQSTNKF
jgi:hypothetical protein